MQLNALCAAADGCSLRWAPGAGLLLTAAGGWTPTAQFAVRGAGVKVVAKRRSAPRARELENSPTPTH